MNKRSNTGTSVLSIFISLAMVFFLTLLHTLIHPNTHMCIASEKRVVWPGFDRRPWPEHKKNKFQMLSESKLRIIEYGCDNRKHRMPQAHLKTQLLSAWSNRIQTVKQLELS